MSEPPRPSPGRGDPSCPHRERIEGVCISCGHCDHELILNGACFACGTTDLDPIALSPKRPSVIPASMLVRKK
ncbi:MAG TPA: hypothetical protein VFQ53_35585 [Kofleriaceae bacterium]|nr:hypothetical protein [Kofleriaceae bacterium]